MVSDFKRNDGCAKMDVCGSVEQTKTVIFNAFDNLERPNATLRVIGYFGDAKLSRTMASSDQDEGRDLPVHRVDNFLYEFGFSPKVRGIVILEIYVDDVQISESPIQVNVIERNCDADFPGQDRISVSVALLFDFLKTRKTTLLHESYCSL